MVMWPEDAARLADYDRLAAELARVKTEGTPGVMHEVDRSFYNLVIQERDYARLQVENRNQQLGELRAEVQRLKAQLDEVQHRRVLLCPSAHIPAAMATSMGEEDGTLIRASDDPGLEWVLKEGAWVPTG